MEDRGDAWEEGWEGTWAQPDEPDRNELHELARRLADQRREQKTQQLVELEDMKRALRERAADVSRRELEVERRERDLAESGDRRRESWLRLRRAEPAEPTPDADYAYTEELLERREADVQAQADALAPRERDVTEREAALRAREIEIEDALVG